jgi:hypothetical protein
MIKSPNHLIGHPRRLNNDPEFTQRLVVGRISGYPLLAGGDWAVLALSLIAATRIDHSKSASRKSASLVKAVKTARESMLQ